MMRNRIFPAGIVVTLMVLGLVYRWWSQGPEEYGEYVPVRCIQGMAPGQSCVQKELNAQERAALTKGKKQHDDGSFEVSVSSERLKLVDLAIATTEKSKSKRQEEQLPAVRREASRCAAGNFSVLALVPEFPGRWSAVYRTQEGRRMLFSRYDFYASGGGLGSFEYLLRSRVNGRPATLMLMNSVHGNTRMWEVLWEGDGVSFELEVEDVKSKDAHGEPYTANGVLQIASMLDASCHWARARIDELH